MLEKDKDPTGKDIKNMLSDFHAETETDLEENLLKDWNMVRCVICHRQLDLLVAAYLDDEPVHQYCL